MLDKNNLNNFISHPTYKFKGKGISPKVLCFLKELNFTKKVVKASIDITSFGVYNLYINDQKVNEEYLMPGFTNYKKNLQYQTYDITRYLKANNNIYVLVAGGWAVGSFVFTRKNRVYADKQMLLAKITICFEDGEQIYLTDDSWKVSDDTPILMSDLYDGETYDANINFNNMNFCNASNITPKFKPNLLNTFGSPIKVKATLKPEVIKNTDNKIILDFKQNFAGVVNLNIKNAIKGQRIVIKHAEVLSKDGDLLTEILRSAKATITYICKNGKQEYTPNFTYMGFRYISIEGINLEEIDVTGIVLSSEIEEIGEFSCSNELLNRLQKNILWSSYSNFMDIPTDCPQRDERMGWTGDIAAFANTALFNFDLSNFLSKWLLDLRSEQLKTGGIPNTVPSHGYGFPATMPKMAVDFWGDACILVPKALYEATGDIRYIKENYLMMKKYVDACLFWAHLLSLGDYRYIWHTPSLFHFGDWLAPDSPKMSIWQKRSIYTATCSLKNTSNLLADFAKLLGKEDDYLKYKEISNKVSKAFINKLTNKNGKINNEFQTGYVLPLYYNIFEGEQKKLALENLVNLIRKNDHKISTGFPGTPYILFVLADNGYEEDALKMLFNTECPSWLYEVKVGATTIWERWDGLDEEGNVKLEDDGTHGMISYNHYASGAVGDFLYKRLAGIQPLEAGYKKVLIKPIINKAYLTSCHAKTKTPFGVIEINYEIVGNEITLKVTKPNEIICNVELFEKTYDLTENFSIIKGEIQ